MIATTSSGQQLPKSVYLFFSLVEKKDDDYLHTPLFSFEHVGSYYHLEKNTVALKGFFLLTAATLQATLHNQLNIQKKIFFSIISPLEEEEESCGSFWNHAGKWHTHTGEGPIQHFTYIPSPYFFFNPKSSFLSFIFLFENSTWNTEGGERRKMSWTRLG